MKTIVPSYYRKFRCTASECRHNCCREGWEIDIDDIHTALYRKLSESSEDAFSACIRNGIYFPTVKERRNGEVPHILLKDNGTCPFLNEKGLCRLILNCGEKAICDICTDHPRFRNFYRDHIELGIGMCCEEACRIILEEKNETVYEDLHTGKREIPGYKRALGDKTGSVFDGSAFDGLYWAEKLRGLERLEKEWTDILERYKIIKQEKTAEITGHSCEFSPEWERMFRNLKEYFLFRHGTKNGYGFASFSVRLIREMASAFELEGAQDGVQKLMNICRLYSSEIEYSEENLKTAVQFADSCVRK